MTRDKYLLAATVYWRTGYDWIVAKEGTINELQVQ